jgi:hypothetical protein
MNLSVKICTAYAWKVPLEGLTFRPPPQAPSAESTFDNFRHGGGGRVWTSTAVVVASAGGISGADDPVLRENRQFPTLNGPKMAIFPNQIQ